MEGKNLKYQAEKLKESFLEEMKEKEKKDFEESLRKLNQELGVDLEQDILSLFDQNYALFVGSEPSGEKAPLLGFVAQIKNENRTKETFLKIKFPKEITEPISASLKGASGPKPEKLKPKERVGFKKQIIDGLEIYSLPILGNLSLSFSVKDKKIFLVLGEKEDLINLLKKNSKKLKDANLFSSLFQEAPQKISQIQYGYPYGYLGPLKYTVNFFVNLFAQYLTSPKAPSSFGNAYNAYIALLYEFLDKGIAPYLKVLKASGSYSWIQEEGLIVTKSSLLIEELPLEEKKAAEDFWQNIQNWLNNFFPSPSPYM